MRLTDATKLKTSELAKEMREIYEQCVPAYPAGTLSRMDTRMRELINELELRSFKLEQGACRSK